MTTQQIRQLVPQIELSYMNAAQALASARDAILRSELGGDSSDRAKALIDRRVGVESIVLSHDKMERIAEAKRRIEQGMFGICTDCGENISESRLRALPWAEKCITCQRAEDDRLAKGAS